MNVIPVSRFHRHRHKHAHFSFFHIRGLIGSFIQVNRLSSAPIAADSIIINNSNCTGSPTTITNPKNKLVIKGLDSYFERIEFAKRKKV